MKGRRPQVAGEAGVKDQKRAATDIVIFIVVSPPFYSSRTGQSARTVYSEDARRRISVDHAAAIPCGNCR